VRFCASGTATAGCALAFDLVAQAILPALSPLPFSRPPMSPKGVHNGTSFHRAPHYSGMHAEFW
jgi:hypothetical protein